MMALWIVLMAVAVVFFVVTHTVILPKLFLKVRFKLTSPSVNGVKVVEDREGRKILYKTDSAIRKYISGYVMAEKGNKKQIICKVGDNVRYVDYDIVCFNNLNKPIDVINVKEYVGASGYTNSTAVPDKAAYALICLNECDGRKFENDTVVNVSNLQLAIYLISCLAVEILTVFLIRLCFANLLGGIYGESFMISPNSTGIAWIICAAVFVINTVVSVLSVKLKYRKKGIENEQK